MSPSCRFLPQKANKYVHPAVPTGILTQPYWQMPPSPSAVHPLPLYSAPSPCSYTMLPLCVFFMASPPSPAPKRAAALPTPCHSSCYSSTLHIDRALLWSSHTVGPVQSSCPGHALPHPLHMCSGVMYEVSPATPASPAPAPAPEEDASASSPTPKEAMLPVCVAWSPVLTCGQRPVSLLTLGGRRGRVALVKQGLRGCEGGAAAGVRCVVATPRDMRQPAGTPSLLPCDGGFCVCLGNGTMEFARHLSKVLDICQKCKKTALPCFLWVFWCFSKFLTFQPKKNSHSCLQRGKTTFCNTISCSRYMFPCRFVGRLPKHVFGSLPTIGGGTPSPLCLGGKRCSPQGPVSSEVTKAQRAHRGLRSLQCPWDREVLGTPWDILSIRTPPAGLALCAAPPVLFWVSQGAPQTTRPERPVQPSRVQLWARGTRRSPNPHAPPAALVLASPAVPLGPKAVGTHNPPRSSTLPPHRLQDSTCRNTRWARHLPAVRPCAPPPPP